MLRIKGVGKIKIEKYGNEFLEVIVDHVGELS